jgi:hypothetical protein
MVCDGVVGEEWETVECACELPCRIVQIPSVRFPFIGTTNYSGVTTALTMLYRQLCRDEYPHTIQFRRVISPHVYEYDNAVHQLVDLGLLLRATQPSNLPARLTFDCWASRRFGKSEFALHLYDVAGEIMSQTVHVGSEILAVHRAKREIILSADGWLLFLDPEHPFQHQAEVLKDALCDIRRLAGGSALQSRLKPLAVCLSKVDMLPALLKGTSAAGAREIEEIREVCSDDPARDRPPSRHDLARRSQWTKAVCRLIWPEWQIETEVQSQYGDRFMFFPMTAFGVPDERDAPLDQRNLSPCGLLNPVLWLLQQYGYRVIS